ncbi:ankyrin repeat domain-containing protein 31 isoform X2 [Macrotis lagotis]|uniref:ankyrin repeat domain-containing protein 31 isoform X2 n=1 Tax=Macrotis lagotis TaxID=92651 RepID=UPI003D695599
MDCSLFPKEGLPDNQVLNSECQNKHSYSSGFDAEDLGFLQRPEKELSDGGDSPEISLLSGAVITSYATVELKKKSSEKLEGSSVLSESTKEITLPSREIRGEDSSCEMLVPTTEDSLGLSESILSEYPFIVNEFDSKELLKPPSDLGSPKSMSPLNHLLTFQEDGLREHMQENEKNSALPAEQLTALNTFSESVCQRMERSSRPCAEDECLGTELSISQTDDDCTQITEMDFEFHHSVQSFGQDPKLTEPFLKATTMQQDKEDPSSLEQETVKHENVACLDGFGKEEALNSMETNTAMETSYVLRKSARLKRVRTRATSKNIDEIFKMPEERLQKTYSILPTGYFRKQDSPFQNSSDEKSVEWSKNQILSAYHCDEHIIKKRRTANRKSYSNISKLSSINRRDIYGESPLHKAAQTDDSALIKKFIQLGGNVNLRDYAGWTALHEASVDGFYKTVLELLKGGADVNCKGMKQITPIYDAVLNGHYEVAELLLQNGADPLFRNDFGKCALDEARDPHMKQLLEHYIHKPRQHPITEQRNRSELLPLEDTYQNKKPECNPRSTQNFNNENSRGIKERKIKVAKRNKGNLLRNKGAVNENQQKILKNEKLIPTGNEQSTADQINAKVSPKIHMQDVHEPWNFGSMEERKNRTISKTIEMSDRKSNTRISLATSLKRIDRSIAHHQQDSETLCDLSEKSGMLTDSVILERRNHECHYNEVFSVSKGSSTCENDANSLVLMSQEEPGQNIGSVDSQKESKSLESETAGLEEAVPFSGLPFCEEAKLSLTPEGNDHTAHHEKPVAWEVSDYNNPSQKSERVTAWEMCFVSFVGRNADSGNDRNDDGDGGFLSEGTALFKKMTCFVNNENQSDYKANSEHKEQSTSPHHLISETQSLLQENVFQAGNPMTISQQDIVNLSDSDCTIISEICVENEEQNIKRIISDVDPEQILLTSSKTLSMPDLSEQISGVERSTSLHNNSTTAPSCFINQTDEASIIVRGKESSEGPCIEKTQESHPKSPECTGQYPEKEATKMEIKQVELPESDVIPNKNVQSTRNFNKDLRNASQLKQELEKTMLSLSDKEVNDSVNREQNTERSHKEARGKRNPALRNLQLCEKRVQAKRKRQDLQETVYSQDLNSSISTNKDLQNQSQQEDSPDPKASEIPEPLTFEDTQVLSNKPSCRTVYKRHVKGKSQLHLATKRGHLSLVKVLIESGAQLNQKGCTALDEAANKGFNEVMVELLKTGADVNSESQDGLLPTNNAVLTNHLKHEFICTILHAIEEEQESLLLSEMRTPEDADQYNQKMLQIESIMDNVFTEHRKERDELAKKYRASMESFKQGAQREQLANLATRQKKLLMIVQKQKTLSQSIQNSKITRNWSGLGVSRESPDSRNSVEIDRSTCPAPVERTTKLASLSVPVGSPTSPTNGSSEQTYCAAKSRQKDNQNLENCISESRMHEKAGESDYFSFNELISKRTPVYPNLERTSKSNYNHGIEKVKLPFQPVTSGAPAEYFQGNYVAVSAKGSSSLNPSAITKTLNVLETTSTTIRSNTHQPSTVCQPTLTSCLLPDTAKKTVSQDPPWAISEPILQSFLTHQGNAQLDSGAFLRRKPYHTESRPDGALADNSQMNFSSESANQNNKQEPLNNKAEMKMKKIQIKELISQGRIKPGNDILEFKMQDVTYKASILTNGKIKAKNGEIYQNPVTWIKALLGSNIYVTWKYVWNKVTYLGKELSKYITEEVPVTAEPNMALQENQPCLPGPSSDSIQNLTHYLQLNEILLISNQEFLPCNIMDQHWKFYMTSKDGPF